ncbi:MAG: hypothetical protein K8L99_03870 [Anaerolineae bacterium]|nr:hypothetical protein [Anaerolineae bacterium]
MHETSAIIERVKGVGHKIQHVELAVHPLLADMKAGQSILVRLNKSWDPYLREQWWPVKFAPGKITVERPREIHYEPGSEISVFGPIGDWYRFRRTLRHVLLLAYDTPPTPLLSMIPMLLANQTSVTLVLNGSAITYDTRHLSPEVEVVHGDADLNWPNRVMMLGLADQVFAVVRPDDEILRFAKIWQVFEASRAEIPRNYLFGVFNPVLPCGAGACQACMIRLKQGVALTCMDGPAIDLSQVML